MTNKVAALLSWDESVTMPPGGAPGAGGTDGDGRSHRTRAFVAPEVGRMLDDLQAYQQSLPRPDDASLIRDAARLREGEKGSGRLERDGARGVLPERVGRASSISRHSSRSCSRPSTEAAVWDCIGGGDDPTASCSTTTSGDADRRVRRIFAALKEGRYRWQRWRSAPTP
jgi:hypothetical protein